MAENNTAKRGFAAMDPERRREIASKGGKSSRRTDGKNKASSANAATANTGSQKRTEAASSKK